MASIEVTASYTAWNFDCNVSLSDCNRRIDLDFNMWEPKNVKAKMEKLDLLIKELAGLQEYLNTATEDFTKLSTEARKKKKDNKNIISILEDLEDD